MNNVYSTLIAVFVLTLVLGCSQTKPKVEEKSVENFYESPLYRQYSEFLYRRSDEPVDIHSHLKVGTALAKELFLRNEFWQANHVIGKLLKIQEMSKEQRYFLLKLSADCLMFLNHHGNQERIVPIFVRTRFLELKGPSYGAGYYAEAKERLSAVIATMEKEKIYCDRFRIYSQIASLCCDANDRKEATFWKDKALAEYKRYSTSKNETSCGPDAAVNGIPLYLLDRVKADKKAYQQKNAVALFLSDLLGVCSVLEAKDDMVEITKIWQQAGCYMPINRDALLLLIDQFPEEDRDKFPAQLNIYQGDYNVVHDALLQKDWEDEADKFERDWLRQAKKENSFDSMLAGAKEVMEGALRRNDVDTADGVLVNLLDKFEKYKSKDAEHSKKVADAIQYFKNDVNKYNKSFYAKSRIRLEKMK